MCLLVEGGRADTAGVLLRSLLEVWLVSLYILFKGAPSDDTVLLEIAEEDWKYSNIIAQRFPLPDGVKAHIDEWRDVLNKRGARKRPSFEAIAIELSRLLPKDDTGRAPDVLKVYDTVYRMESKFNAHPSPSVFMRYIEWDPKEEADSVVANPGPPFSWSELVGSSLTLYLATHVLKAFSIVPDQRFLDLDAKLSKDTARLSAEADAQAASEAAAAPKAE
jgi:hypothetical protein